VMSIHSRGAESEVLDVLEKHPRAGVAVLHWFSGTQGELQRAIELGAWFSVGPAMLRGLKGRELAARMPSGRVLPETDGPFAQDSGRPLMPWEAWNVCPSLAAAWGRSTDEVQERMLSNLRRLLPSAPLA
jgi:TatD DNase family protein